MFSTFWSVVGDCVKRKEHGRWLPIAGRRRQTEESVCEGLTSPINLTPLLSNSPFSFAKAPSSVVHTGVKSAGCEKRIAHLSPIHSWKSMSPCVVLALKFGASEPRRNRGWSFSVVGVANERRRKGVAVLGIVVRAHWDRRADGRREDGRAMRDAILKVGYVLGFRTNRSSHSARGEKNVDKSIIASFALTMTDTAVSPLLTRHFIHI